MLPCEGMRTAAVTFMAYTLVTWMCNAFELQPAPCAVLHMLLGQLYGLCAVWSRVLLMVFFRACCHGIGGPRARLAAAQEAFCGHGSVAIACAGETPHAKHSLFSCYIASFCS